MKKILIGALVCAAVAGVVYYLQNPEKVNDLVDDLKDKGNDALKKAKGGFAKTSNQVSESYS